MTSATPEAATAAEAARAAGARGHVNVALCHFLRAELMVQRRRDRAQPPARTVENRDLIATCGAYGFAMGSNYNLRPPAAEFILES